MSIRPKIRQRQVQRLSLTPALRQSISILALSDRQLTELVETELAENPLLKELSPKSGGNSADYQFALDRVADKPSLAEHLQRQIALSNETRQVRQIAEYLSSDLSDQGFLQESDQSIAQLLGLNVDLIRRGIDVLHTCEPSGIGARNLAESLSLQLKTHEIPEDQQEIVVQNLELFAKSDWPAIRRKSGLPLKQIRSLADLLLTLSPYPAANFVPDIATSLFPDVHVLTNSAGDFTVELLGSTAPSLAVEKNLIAETKHTDPSILSYVKTNTVRANALISAIEARSKTILRVCREIVEFQHGFFSKGHDHLRPQSQGDIAANLNVHPSTITRALANKALSCDFGTFPLKFFFTSSVNSLGHGDPQSAYVIQQEIRRMISAETVENILADDAITQKLRQDGVDIARRTVAKYRQCLNIPSSVQRRRSKRKL